MAAPEENPPCGLCGAAAPPYTCPRCHRRLCSLRCYRAHGPCAEAFYRDQVLQELRDRRAPPRGLPAALDPPAGPAAGLWQRLSEAERREFLRLVSSGEAAALLPPWRPWWWRGRALVEPLGEPDPSEPRPGPSPPVPTDIPALSALRSAPPSPSLRFQLPNVLFGYAFALSLHLGDASLVPELPGAALAASAALRSRRPFRSTAEALRAARTDVSAAGLPLGPLGDSGALLAVAQLLEGRPGRGAGADTASALGHLRALLAAGARAVEGPERGRFRAARKKVEFLLSWSRESPAELARLAREVREVHAEVAAEEAAVAELVEGMGRVGEGSGGPWLIKEGEGEGPLEVGRDSGGLWGLGEGVLGGTRSPPSPGRGLGGPLGVGEGVEEGPLGVGGGSGGPQRDKKGVPGGLRTPSRVQGRGRRLIEELD